MTANDRQIGGDHYKQGGEEHWDRIWRLHGRGYFVGCITKYVERYHLKNGVEDLRKARHFLDKLIELESSECGQTWRKVTAILNPFNKPIGDIRSGEPHHHYYGFTYEGGTADWDAYRCVTCKTHFHVNIGAAPTCPQCQMEDATPAYVAQGAS